MNFVGQIEELDLITREIQKCEACAFCKSRKNVVPGEGDANASLMLIGEAPGQSEDKAGRPFVGRAGQLLHQALEKYVGLKRNEVWLGNTIKCHPPKNVIPPDYDLSICKDFIIAQIATVKPMVVVVMGTTAFNALLGGQIILQGGGRMARAADLRGKVLRYQGMYWVPVYHPAAALHNLALVEELSRNFAVVGSLLRRVGITEEAPGGQEEKGQSQ